MSIAILIVVCSLFVCYALYFLVFRMQGNDVNELRRILLRCGFDVQLKNKKCRNDKSNGVYNDGSVNKDYEQEELRFPRHVAVIMGRGAKLDRFYSVVYASKS